MNKAFEKILERLEETDFNDIQMTVREVLLKYGFPYESVIQDEFWDALDELSTNKFAKRIVQEVAQEYNDGWIPVISGNLPKTEEEVFILTEKGTMTTAMYEDGTVFEGDSVWRWYDCEFEYDEDADDYIIPEGWWEYRHFNMDDVYNNAVDEVVIAWQPLPESYQPKGE